VVGVVGGLLLAAAAFEIRNGGAARQLVRDREDGDARRALSWLGRQLHEIEARSKEQTEVFDVLPDLVRQMFSATGKRPMYPVVVKLVELFFRPAQVAIFVALPAERKLRLVEGMNLPDTLPKSAEIEYGQGRPGHVAETRMAMDESDFANVSTITRLQLESSRIDGLRADVAAPILYDDQLLGVITVGGAAARPDHEKRLLKMVADLAASALVHVQQLKSSQEQANMDGLTETYNKRYLQNRLSDDIKKAEAASGPLSLLILDIDHFKHYNDTNGHLEGDDVLKRIGAILKHQIRDDTDVVVRYGGEEFVIVFPGATKAVAARQAENIRRAVEAHPFKHAARQPLGAVTISGGVAAFPEDGKNQVALLRAADQALYEAKAAGRNRIVNATPNSVVT
jgi:diguanylate cyclase (GGDEF)-like protein